MRTTRKPAEFYVCLRQDYSGVPKLHSHEGGGSLGACTPELGGQDRHLGSKGQWPIRSVTSLFQADCHARPRWCQTKGLAGDSSWTLHLTADPDRRPGLLWHTLTVTRQSARAGFGRNSEHLEPVGTKSLGRSREPLKNRPSPTSRVQRLPMNERGAILRGVYPLGRYQRINVSTGRVLVV